MSNSLLVVTTIINFGIAFGYLRSGDHGMTLTFSSYALACVGFVWSNLSRGL